MTEKGMEKAAHVADMMQTIARLLVLVIIIPSAIWLALFYLLGITGVIPDASIRGLFSLTFGLGLAGILIARMRYPVRGSIITALAAVSGSFSLALFWNSIFVSSLILHIFLIVLLVIFKYLRTTLSISHFKWMGLRSVLGAAIITTAIFPTLFFGFLIQLSLLALMGLVAIVLWFYITSTQYLLREPRLGIAAIVLPALSVALLQLSSQLVAYPSSDLSITVSILAVSFGVSLLILSQTYRFIQNSLSRRPINTYRKQAKVQNLLRETGILLESEKQVAQQEPVEAPEWLIVRAHAHQLSGISLLCASAALPVLFLWRVSDMSWSAQSEYLTLFLPLAVLLALLVAIPAPVFFRLGGALRRSVESKLAKSLGVLVVVDATLGLYIWTQYYSWLTFFSYHVGQFSVPLSVLLLATGITGLFKEIRELWRAAWIRIAYSFRLMLYYIRTHYIQAGLFSDGVLTACLVFILLPELSQYPAHLLLIGLLSGIVFTVIAMSGAAAMRHYPRRNTVLSIGISFLIVSFSLLTFWYLSYVQQNELMYAASWSVTWCMLFAVLQKLHVSRKAISLPFVTGLIPFLLLVHFYEAQTIGLSYYVLTLAAALLLSSALLYKEYALAIDAIRRALVDALRAIGNRVRLGLLHLWDIVYRGAVWIGVQIVRFVLIVYGALLVFFIGQYGYGLLLVAPAADTFAIVSGLALIFLVSFSPSLILKGLSSSRAMSACVMLMAFTLGVFAFSISGSFELLVRVPLAAFLSLSILTAGRTRLHTRVQVALPYVTWLVFVVWLSSSAYYFSESIGFTSALLVSAFVAGLGVLPLKVEHRLSKISTGLYLVLSVPSGIILSYLSFQSILTSIGVMLLLPRVVLDKQYSIALNAITRFLLTGGRKMLAGIRVVGRWIRSAAYHIVSGFALISRWLVMVIAAHIIGAAGTASFGVALLFLQYLMPALFIYEYGEVMAALAFILMADALWLPTMIVRRKDHPDLLSHGLIVLSASFGTLTYLVFLPFGFTVSLLLGISFSSTLLAIAAPSIAEIRSRTMPVVIMLTAILLVGLNLWVADNVVKLGLAVMGLSLLATPLFSSRNRLRIAYPLVTSSFIGTVIYAYVFVTSGFWLAAACFASAESLLLSVPEKVRIWQLWWAFSFSAGCALYLLLGTAPFIQLVLPVLIVVELLRLTPEAEHRFVNQSGQLDTVRATLLAAITWMGLFPVLTALLVFEIAELVFIATLAISLWRFLSDSHQHALANTTALSLSVLAGTYLTAFLGIDLILSMYLAVLPFLISLAYSSFEGRQSIVYWHTLRGVLVILTSAVWYVVYRSVESLLLAAPTAVVITSLLSSWNPTVGIKQQGVSRVTCASIVIFFESLWLWHGFYILAASSSVMILMSSALLFTLLVFPATKSMSWLDFEMVWDVVSIIVSVAVGAYLTAWDIVSLVLPPNPIMTIGWSLSAFSVLSGLSIRHTEVLQREVPSKRISHMAWLPSIPGWALLGFSYGSILDPSLALGLAGFSASLAGVIFVVIHPNPSGRIRATANMMIACSLAYMSWIWLGMAISVATSAVVVGIWFIVGFPTLGPVVYTGLSRAYAFLRLHGDTIAIGMPLVIGAWAGSVFLFQSSCPLLLGLNIRHCFQGLAAAAMSMGILYMVEGAFLKGQLSAQVRLPSVALVERGFPILILGFYLPEAVSDPLLACYLILGSLAVTFPVAAGLNRVYGFKTASNRFWKITGILLLLTSYLGMTAYSIYPPLTALAISTVIAFFVELPFLRCQILSFAHLLVRLGKGISEVLRNLGTVLSRLAGRLAHIIRLFFERFGYFNWVIFSLIFTVGLSYLSGTFFSELLGMNPSGFLYSFPTISMPVFILGLLLLTIAVVRRRVKSPFGVSCIVLSLAGAALTGSSWLFDQGQRTLAVCLGAMLFCIGGLSILIEEGISGAGVSALWAPIPVSAAVVVFSFLNQSSIEYGAVPIASSVATTVGSLLLLLSAYSRLFPESARDPLWITTAVSTGATTFLIFFTTHVPLLASFYFAVFLASLILYPVSFGVSKYLFSSPLFFALTGFAFAFVFGDVYQGLPLALASFLLFIALFIKEKEPERPRLAYLRLAVLLVLLGSLVVFGVSIVSLLA